MKTLNRTLSLALVFALVFSLMSFAFAATTTTTTTTTAATKLSDFTDASKLTYTEAADYLISAGIVKGATTTTLVPQGELTREQAAKIIAYACLGQAAADNLKASAAPFTDVPADRWSAGYIAYAQKNGYINGYGDGNFGPNDKVTGYQYAKMLLCALGYGVNGEFTGAGWDLEVAKLALAKDIFKNHTEGASNVAANREEAFLYTFNALTNAMIVKYNESLKVYYSGTNPFENNQLFNKDYTIGYQRFKMVSTPDDGTYSEPAHYWALDGKSVTGTYPDEPIKLLATSSSGTPYANLTTKGDSAYIGYSKDDTVVYYINGDKQTGLTAITAQTNETWTPGVAADLCDFKGNVVNFYDTDKNGKYDTVEVLVYNIAKLDAAPVVSGATGNTVVTIGDIGMSKIPASKITGSYADLKKDDYVLYYSNAKKTSWTIAKAESVTGQMFGFNKTAGQFNINGTNYSYSQITRADSGMDYDDISAAAGLAGTVFYLDAGKNIAAAVPAEAIVAASNVVFVLGQKVDDVSSTFKLLKSDGSIVTKTVSKYVTTGNTTASVTSSSIANYRFYTYTENKDGSYLLKEINTKVSPTTANTTSKPEQSGNSPTYNNSAVFTKGQAKFATGIATTGTNKTVFVLEGDTTSTKGSYKAYTGVSNIPSVTDVNSSNDATAYVLNDKDDYAIMAVELGGKLDTSVLTMDYAFIGFNKSDVTMTANNGDKYYNFPIATLNGEVKAKGIDATESGSTMETGLVAIDKYSDGRADGSFTNSSAYNSNPTTAFSGTRLNRVIFNVLNPQGVAGAALVNNAMNMTTLGFKVEGDTVTFTSMANTPESFVVSKDVKVFIHDLREANTTGKVTIEPQSGVNVLANLPKSDSATTYTYGVSALSVSDKDSTINELYITRYPEGTIDTSTDTTGITDVLDNGDDTYTVTYYGDTAPTEAQGLAAVQKKITDDGWTISKTTLASGTYTFTITKNSIEATKKWDSDNNDGAVTDGVVKLLKVTVNGTEKYLATTTKLNELDGYTAAAKYVQTGSATPVDVSGATTTIAEGKSYVTGLVKVTMATTKNNPNAEGVNYTVTDSDAVTYAKVGAKFNLVITTDGTSTGSTAVIFTATNATMVNGAVTPAAANAGMTSVVVSGGNVITFTPAGTGNAAGVYTIEVTVGNGDVSFA